MGVSAKGLARRHAEPRTAAGPGPGTIPVSAAYASAAPMGSTSTCVLHQHAGGGALLRPPGVHQPYETVKVIRFVDCSVV